MSHQELTDALASVHRELANADQLDPGDVERLQATMKEIEVAIQQRAKTDTSLSENVTDAATSFEESHPRLTMELGRIADMLQQMGF
ncbi:hypothetical protein Poly51_28960 [Rubripirellula tenax]|uniref:DUF4404 domain-containing protein n=1 Tax=Rubripirellula tenax TaxID=2528015 RepID=A0A5C6F9X8_9BACT|nr:DUF4404 family protein [Rubripirellula tenax]TWU56976.1 hypothetical protein Poly51_28960 [Rubripirellula tenax]